MHYQLFWNQCGYACMDKQWKCMEAWQQSQQKAYRKNHNVGWYLALRWIKGLFLSSSMQLTTRHTLFDQYSYSSSWAAFMNATEGYCINFQGYHIACKWGNSLGRHVISNAPNRGRLSWEMHISSPHVNIRVSYQELWFTAWWQLHC